MPSGAPQSRLRLAAGSASRRAAAAAAAVVAVAAVMVALKLHDADPFSGGARHGAPGAASPAAAPGPPASPARAESHPPIVMVVLDEFSLVSLLDRSLRIDPVEYPNLAALARNATVYRAFTAPGDDTSQVTPALLTGNLWRVPRARPTPAAYPHTLFTLLAPRYRMYVREEASTLCPRGLCPGDPPTPNPQAVLSRLAHGRVARFDAWVRGIRPSRRPTLYYKHALLPHGPWKYLPDGRLYQGSGLPHVTDVENSAPDPWLGVANYQRHLLQVQLVDRLLGRLVARLKATGLYDRSLIVITADNGEAFGHRFHESHIADRATAADIASTPLIVKLPHQRRGGYSDRHVRTFDLVPTIARVAHMRLTWRVRGRSFLHGRGDRGPVVVYQRHGPPIAMSLARFRARLRAAVRRKLAWFGDHGSRLWQPGPHRELVGRPVAKVPHARAGSMRASLYEGRRLANVRMRSGFVPALVIARVRGRGARAGLPVAIALDGTIVTTARTARLAHDRNVYAPAVIPPERFHDGVDRVSLYLVVSGRGGVRLRPM